LLSPCAGGFFIHKPSLFLATYELPYEGAKEMLLVEDIENREFLCNLFLSMYEELPAPKRKKNTSKNNDKKPLAMSFIPTAKGFLIWIIRCTATIPPFSNSKTTGP
jgi:hypothetical protein